jgi:hypothetical protein
MPAALARARVRVRSTTERNENRSGFNKTYEKLRRKGFAAEQRAFSGIASNLARIRFMAANAR